MSIEDIITMLHLAKDKDTEVRLRKKSILEEDLSVKEYVESSVLIQQTPGGPPRGQFVTSWPQGPSCR